MSLLESLQVSVFGLGIVFAVLVSLSLLIRLLSGLTAHIDKSISALQGQKNNKGMSMEKSEQKDSSLSCGELKLIEVEEKTAAIIMAIVSHESQIPLSELQFKCIKAID